MPRAPLPADPQRLYDIKLIVTASASLESARTAAFAKLGRNIALFQQLEAGLKAYFNLLVVEGSSAEDVARRISDRNARLASRSLGQVVRTLFDDLTPPRDGADDSSLPGDPPFFMRARFRVEGPFIDDRKRALEHLIDERNRLIHHLGEDYDLRSIEGIARLDAALKPQAERIREELRALRSLLEELGNQRQKVGELMASAELRSRIEREFLCASPLIRGLSDIAAMHARSDGWTMLARATQILRERDPDALTHLKARYGHSRVKALLHVSGMFELRDEATQGGQRLLYRPIASPAVE